MFGSEYVKHCARQLGYVVEFERTNSHDIKVRVHKGGYPKAFRWTHVVVLDDSRDLTADVSEATAQLIGALLWDSVQP